MKKLAVLASLLCLMATAAIAQEILVDKIIGVVGDQMILHSDVQQQLALIEKQQGVLPDEARCGILEQLLVQKMLIVRAQLDSIELNDEEVEGQLDARIQQILSYMNGDVKQFIEYYGKSPDDVKEDFREDLRNQLLAQRMQQTVMDRVKVTPSEVVSFYNKIPKDSLPYFNSEVEVGEIVLKPQPSEEVLQATYDTLVAIRQRILDGVTTFEVAAKAYSQDPGSARLGGDLGWAQRGKFVPEFEASAYNLQQDEISMPVKTQFGYHIIQLLGRRGNLVRTRHILVKPRIRQADVDKAYAKLDSIRLLVAGDSISFEYAVARFSEEDEQSKTNAGVILNPQTGVPGFEIGDLPPEIFFAIDTMDVGNISAPIRFEDMRTDEVVFKAIYLMSRTDPHVANLQDDYAKIQNAALERKKLQYMNEWVNNQKDKIFIRINDEYSDCADLILGEPAAIKPR